MGETFESIDFDSTSSFLGVTCTFSYYLGLGIYFIPDDPEDLLPGTL